MEKLSFTFWLKTTRSIRHLAVENFKHNYGKRVYIRFLVPYSVTCTKWQYLWRRIKHCWEEDMRNWRYKVTVFFQNQKVAVICITCFLLCWYKKKGSSSYDYKFWRFIKLILNVLKYIMLSALDSSCLFYLNTI